MISFPISDEDEDEYGEQLYQGALFLNNLIAHKGHTVFVHCTTGVSRSPTLALLYLSLFCQTALWKQLGKVVDLI